MSQIQLSILLITFPERATYLAPLIAELDKQRAGYPVEIMYLGDCRSLHVGKKRNLLKSIASGKYSIWIDDDDWIEPNYVSEIMKGVEQDPDCVTFNNKVFLHEPTLLHPKVHRSIFKLEHKKRRLDSKTKTNYLLPCHINAIRHSIAMKHDFPDGSYCGADFSWSERIQPELRTEYHINKELYHHRCNHTPDKKQGNFKKRRI